MVKYGKYSLAKFANFVYICITRGESRHFRGNFSSKMATFFAHNTNTYTGKIWKLLKVRFFVFYKISPPNFAMHSTNFKILFLVVVKDFVLSA